MSFPSARDEAVALSGSLVVTAAENGAEVAAAYVGPAVPRLAQSATGGGDARGRAAGDSVTRC